MAKFLPNACVPLFFSAALIVFYYFAPHIFLFPDSGWHIAAGELISQKGSAVLPNSWAHTSPNEPWINIAWLHDYVLFYLADTFGLEAMFYYTITLSSLTLTITFMHCLQRGVRLETALIVCFLIGFAMLYVMSIRPQVVGYFFVSVFFFLLFMYESGKIHTRYLTIILSVIMLLWVNMHGSFMAGFIVLGCYFLQYMREENYTKAKLYFFIGTCCFIMTFINPYSWQVYALIKETLSHPITAQISEWQPIQFFVQDGISMHLLVFILAGLLATNHKGLSFGEKLLMFIWFIMAIKSVRNYAIFTLLSAPFFAVALNGIKKDPKEEVLKLAENIDFRKRAIPYSLVLVTIGLLVAHMMFPRQDVLGAENNNQPEVKFIVEHYPDMPIFNFYNYGGALIYFSNGKLAPFIDGRIYTAYSDDIIDDYLSVYGSEDGWQEIFTKYGIRLVMLPKSDDVAKKLVHHEEWKNVWEREGSRVSIFVKK